MLGRGEQGECGRAGISPRSLSSSSAGNTPAPKPISAGAAWGSRFMSMIDICLSCAFCVCVCVFVGVFACTRSGDGEAGRQTARKSAKLPQSRSTRLRRPRVLLWIVGALLRDEMV